MRTILGYVFLAALLCAQQKVTLQQLVQFVRSSVQMKHEDNKVADYIRKQITLSQRLDEATFNLLRSTGIGPRTLAALQELQAASRSLPSAPVAPLTPAAPTIAIEPPSAAEQKRVIEEARDYALNYTKRLPNFICTQVTRRYQDPSGLEFWAAADTITAKLSFFEQKENYQVVLVNNRPVDTTMDRIGGATSAGEFGSMMRELFEPKTNAQFQWERWATLRGQRTNVYAYRVAQPNSQWRITYQRAAEAPPLSVVPGYRGLVYVERDSNVISRIVLEADDIPPSFPIQQASERLDYDLVSIG